MNPLRCRRSMLVISITAFVFLCLVTAVGHQFWLVATAQDQPGKPANKPDTKSPAIPSEKARAIPATSTRLQDEDLFPQFLTWETTLDVVDKPLAGVCQILEQMHDVPILLNQAALRDAGIEPSHPITLTLPGLAFEEVLNHLTRQLSLTWRVDGDIVRITTPSTVQLLTRQHDLRPLTKQGHSLPSLLNVLALATSEWDDVGTGHGTLAPVGEFVIARQTFPKQRRIALVLAALEQRQPMVVLRSCTARHRLLTALKESTEVLFTDNPLPEVLNFLSDLHHVPFLLDTQALVDAGINPERPMMLSLGKRTLEKQLELLLSEPGLTYQIRDGVILITTIDRADEEMEWVMYNILDLAATVDLQAQLTEALLQTTSGRWETIDGEGGGLVLTNVGGYLLVKQSDRVQFEIQAILDQLRHTRTERSTDVEQPAPQPNLVTRSYRMPTEAAVDLSKTLPSLVAPESWVKSNDRPPVIHRVASVPQLEPVDGLVSGGPDEIRLVNPPKSNPKDGGTPDTNAIVRSIVVRPRSMLIIRQTPHVHREIQQFLQKLGVVVETGVLD